MATWSTPSTAVAGTVATAAWANTYIRDNMNVGRGFIAVRYTSGSVTMNSATWATVTTSLDLTLPAATNDRLKYTPNVLIQNEAFEAKFDVIATASSTAWGQNSAESASNYGATGWYSAVSQALGLSGGLIRALVSGDISGGNVVARLRYAQSSGGNKTFLATSAIPALVMLENMGPAVNV